MQIWILTHSRHISESIPSKEIHIIIHKGSPYLHPFRVKEIISELYRVLTFGHFWSIFFWIFETTSLSVKWQSDKRECALLGPLIILFKIWIHQPPKIPFSYILFGLLNWLNIKGNFLVIVLLNNIWKWVPINSQCTVNNVQKWIWVVGVIGWTLEIYLLRKVEAVHSPFLPFPMDMGYTQQMSKSPLFNCLFRQHGNFWYPISAFHIHPRRSPRSITKTYSQIQTHLGLLRPAKTKTQDANKHASFLQTYIRNFSLYKHSQYSKCYLLFTQFFR